MPGTAPDLLASFRVTFSFVQLLHALMPISPSGAREAAAGQKASEDVFALSTRVQALQGGS